MYISTIKLYIMAECLGHKQHTLTSPKYHVLRVNMYMYVHALNPRNEKTSLIIASYYTVLLSYMYIIHVINIPAEEREGKDIGAPGRGAFRIALLMPTIRHTSLSKCLDVLS